MSIDIKVPTFPESIADGTIATWYKKPGDSVARDELIVDIETDKVVLEVVAPTDGTITEVLKEEGATVESEEIIGRLEEGGAAQPTAAKPEGETAPVKDVSGAAQEAPRLSPAARKLVEQHGLSPQSLQGSGKGGLVTKEDALQAVEQLQASSSQPQPAAAEKEQAAEVPAVGERIERRVPMTRLRARIAERLLEASQSTAMLTTFNEVNMQPVMQLRDQYREVFEKTHGVRLGFMGFFVKAACEALKRFPAVNASIDGTDIVYHGYQDIGVAVSTEKGLVVPVLRDADQLSTAAIEAKIRELGLRARDGKLSLEEIQGGTFTITNGGVFGSLLSTPILNPPQTAILGMHKIQDRPMAVNGEVVIQPMMYLALSYDHRLIDGKEAVQFLVTIKELLEDPARILLEI